jgi:hypothetical protein
MWSTVALAQPVLDAARRPRPPLRVLGLGSHRLAVLVIVLLVVIIACIVAYRRR